MRSPHLNERAPGGVGVGGHARGVEENADRIAIEAVLDEHVVVGRDEEVVPGGDAANAELDAVVEQPLLVGHIDDAERLAAEDLLHGEDVADVLRRQAGAEPLRHRKQERAAPQVGELFQVKQQVQAEIVGPCEALLPATDRVAEGVGDERQRRRDAAVLQPGAQAVPVAEQVLAGEDQLKGRIC